jgi:molybdopterin-guanine dinucleotide biosynthesis protein A
MNAPFPEAKSLEIRNNDRVAAIILAGGQSSRMGTDKALIEINGVPLLARVCSIASQCVSQVYVVTPRIEKYEAILPAECRLLREELLPGEMKTQGPLVGFASGLKRVKAEWVLLLACDLPKLEVAELQQWIEYLPDVAPDEIALLPKNNKGWEPLCGFYRRSCLPLLIDFIDRGGRSFQNWLVFHPVAQLPINNFHILFNCNTPEDLRKLDII